MSIYLKEMKHGEERHCGETLEDFADVFADIINVLIFNGCQTVNPEELVDILPRSIYKADGKIYEQERDAAKQWKAGEVTFALLGLENQSEREKRDAVKGDFL